MSLLLQSIYYHNKQQKEAAEKVGSLRSLDRYLQGCLQLTFAELHLPYAFWCRQLPK